MAALVLPKLKERMHEKQNRYIYHLPYSITRQIAQNLDIDNAWQHLAAEIGYTHQQVRVFEMEQRRPGVSPAQQMLTDWQAKNPTAQDLHDKLHKINRRREMQILEAWFTSESEDTQSFYSPKKVNSNDDRTASQIQAALDNFDSKSIKPPGKGQNRKTSPPKVEDVNVNLNRCDTFKDKMEMGSKHLDGGLISKPSIKKQISKEVESEDKTIMHEVGVSGPGKSMDNMASNTALRQRLQNNKSSSGYHKSKDKDVGSSEYHKSKDNDVDYSIALNGIHGFSYKEIVQATDGFSDEYLIGQGAYGKVFHAVLKNTKCAVKKLFSREDVNGNIEQQVKRELATLSKYRHNNIVLLYGYMIDQPDVSMADVCLVYQLMPNGSLEDRIACKDNTPALTWKQRLGILRGAACGLQFLHTLTDTPLIHGDIKSGNILLDSNFEAKISDLGMAQHATTGSETGLLTHITKKQADTKQYQTRAYLPPEAQRGSKMSVKGDTYSYGVVIYEVCTGEKSYDERREGTDNKFLVEYMIEMVGDNEEKFYNMCDPNDKNIPQDLYNSVFKLAQACTSKLKKGRPEMKMAFTDLEKLEEDFMNSFDRRNGVCDSVNTIEQTTMQYSNLVDASSHGGCVFVDPSSLDPHLASMLSQIPPGQPIPESLLLQMGYDHRVPGTVATELQVQQKLAEIKKYEEEFNGTKEMVVVEENQEDIQIEENTYENNDEVTNIEENNANETTEPSFECENVESLQQLDDHQPECEGELDLEQERMDREDRRLENLKLVSEEDPVVKEKFTKSRDDFFARFQQQLMFATQYSDESVCENEEEDDDEDNTLVNNDNVQSQNSVYIYNDQNEEQYDSNLLFSQMDENLDTPIQNMETNRNYDHGDKLDAHRQKCDNYQSIAREMSDENGKVVGELIEPDQRPFEGDISESENSLINDFGTALSIETDGDVNVNLNVITNQFSQKNNFTWQQLQRRPEASEGECYV
ncbi:uncharacterized protein LOC127701824 isoform X1 [Mytilus californianus]|uniref:uncharacterized protein LOC127701824 isoform X1 n=2 Tax=Mytilus californianus TaxID=6549 RepID=UPI0022485A13|nr:uncharacterized protein LOC127701824 isoform X1 [Mytilus californianus]